MATLWDRLVGVIKWIGWLILALIVGSLVTVLTSGGVLILALATGATLVAAGFGPRLAARWPVLRSPMMWASLVLVGLAVLVASVRNTPLGLAPVHWISVALASAGLLLGLVELWRGRGIPRWLVAVVAAAILVAVVIDGFGSFSREAVQISNGDVRLSGTLFLPRGEGPFPLVVFAHGAGPELGLVSHHMADRLAREGIAAVAWDKRGSGASRGGSPLDSFEELASDIAAWVTAMRDRRDIAGDRIAIWGWSEGGWTGPLAAAGLDDVAALVLISPAVRVEDAFIYEKEWIMRAAGAGEEEIALASDLQRSVNQHFRTSEGRSGLLAELADASDEDWFHVAFDAGFLIHPADVSEPGSPEADAWIEYMDFSTLEPLSQFTGPVLVAVGLEDRCNPPAEAADEIEQALQDAGNPHRVLRYPGAEHVNLVWLSNSESCGSAGIPPFYYPPGYVDEVTTWLRAVLRRP